MILPRSDIIWRRWGEKRSKAISSKMCNPGLKEAARVREQPSSGRRNVEFLISGHSKLGQSWKKLLAWNVMSFPGEFTFLREWKKQTSTRRIATVSGVHSDCGNERCWRWVFGTHQDSKESIAFRLLTALEFPLSTGGTLACLWGGGVLLLGQNTQHGIHKK